MQAARLLGKVRQKLHARRKVSFFERRTGWKGEGWRYEGREGEKERKREGGKEGMSRKQG